MERENMLRGQRRFAKLHRFLYAIYMLFLLMDAFLFQDGLGQWQMVQIIVMALFTFLDFLLYESGWKFFYGRIPLIHLVKYLQILCVVSVFFQGDNAFFCAMSLLILTIYTLELFLVVDFAQGLIRVVCAVLLCVPTTLAIVWKSLHHQSTYLLITQVLLLIAYFVCYYFLSEYFVNYYKNMQMRLFSQNRIISDINETNEELLRQREQIKETNELLGRQKIELEEAYKIIKRAHLEMSIQNEISHLVSSSLELDSLMEAITESLLQKLDVDVSCIVIRDDEISKERLYKVRTKWSEDYEELLAKEIQKSSIAPLIQNGDFVLDNHVDPTQYDLEGLGKIGSLIVLPLLLDNVLIGYILAADHRRDYFPEDSAFFHTIVTQFLVAIQNAKLYLQMQDMAIRDGLTGIYNRRHLTELFNQDLQQMVIHRNPLTVALFDIDKFKLVNDTYGHIFGDSVVQKIAGLAKEVAVKAGGYTGRYGGEEFVIVFPNRNLASATQFVEELQNRIRNLKLEHNQTQVNVRVSIGVTSYPETCKDPAALLSRADWAMYSSKKNGRDRITIDSDEMQKML